MRVLIVEDVEEMGLLVRHVVEGCPGLKVSGLAKNGWEARLEFSRNRPDLVLLDEVLPGESSLDLLELFQQGQVPVLLMTGVAQPTHSMPAGVLGRLVKPGWNSLETDRKRFSQAIGQLRGKAVDG